MLWVTSTTTGAESLNTTEKRNGGGSKHPMVGAREPPTASPGCSPPAPMTPSGTECGQLSSLERVVLPVTTPRAVSIPLAAAYAEAGRLDDAVRAQLKAIAKLEENHPGTGAYQARLDTYRKGQPWRDSGER